jgi:hypothetical protein
MNNYIEIKMAPTKYNVGGHFMARADFMLDNIEVPFNNIPVKIKLFELWGGNRWRET